jgi:hypothetical protein
MMVKAMRRWVIGPLPREMMASPSKNVNSAGRTDAPRCVHMFLARAAARLYPEEK